ncbi:MAG: hypothetical protein HZB18_12010 [Chloroflexi bacterium]|nr:hypothetical protein [Chloroflexota bacterium]
MEPDLKIDIYIEVLTAIVQRFYKLMGEPALKLARRVYGLHVESDGSVTRFQGDGMIIVQGLVVEYMTLLGAEVVPLTQRAIGPARERNPHIKLPAMLN